MNRFGRLDFACLGVLLVILATTPGFLHGQSPSKPAPPSSPAPPDLPLKQRSDMNFSMEQLRNDARTFGQDLQAELADLSGELAQAAQEVEMSSPGLGKWREFSAQLEEKKDELIARAEELGARAEELAAKVQQEVQEGAGDIIAQAPGIFIGSSEEGGGWLGIEIGEVTPEQARDLKLSSVRGVVVMDVEPDSPASKAGLKEKDVITQYDGQTVEGTVQFRRLVRETPPGRTVGLTVWHEGTSENISVELGDRSAYFEKKMKGKMRDFEGMQMPPLPRGPGPDMPELPGHHMYGMMDWRTPVLGISAEDLTPQLAAYFGAPEGGGVLVREVRAGTPAEKAGLEAGDVIIKVDGEPVHSLGDLRAELRDKSAEKSVNLGILHRGSEMSVPVAIEMPRPLEPMHKFHRDQL